MIMNKTTQDLAWNCLPLEVKKEVKRQYQIATNAKEYYTECTLEYLFGLHNLTSDVKGEEMLTVSRKEVQEEYAVISKELSHRDTDADDYIAWNYVKMTFEELFDSKCLPDKEQIAENANCTEPKPAESTTFNIEHKDIVALHYDLIKLEKSVKTVRELIDKIYKK